ncbi:MAG: DUF1275 domain-containing protein [Bacteroidetes bacterium]|nr:DUF1275 domain-containing protein [Bacteroidota bacterium]
MFRHTGKNRTFLHNLKLASLLSFVAGIVNVSGFFAVHQLTTNVTGHFAFFAEGLVKSEYSTAIYYLLFILSFFTGAFISGLFVETIIVRQKQYIYLLPIATEVGILLCVSLLDSRFIESHTVIISCVLLFAMGLQNSLVTNISNSVVRTTHLTGLFTDLGIELSQLFFYKLPEQQKKLKSSIKLRLAIIGFFFIGCILGGMSYTLIGIKSLLLAVCCLIISIMYDNIRFRVLSVKRKSHD